MAFSQESHALAEMKSPLQLHPGIVVSSAIHQLSEFNGCYKLDNVFFCTIGYPFRVHVLISSHCIPSFYFSHSHHHSHTVTPLDIFSHLKNETRTLVPSLSISAWLGHTHTHSPHSPLKILIFFCICIPAQEPLYSYHFCSRLIHSCIALVVAPFHFLQWFGNDMLYGYITVGGVRTERSREAEGSSLGCIGTNVHRKNTG